MAIERIDIESYETKEEPLWWQKAGLQQTASGYGSKLATTRKLCYAGRWHRIYVMCYSNCGTAYILSKGRRIIVD